MKFGNYLEKKAREEWRGYYLDYKGLKDLIKESAKEAETSGPTAFSPRTTSLSIVRANKSTDAAEERFFQKLENEVRWAAGLAHGAAGGQEGSRRRRGAPPPHACRLGPGGMRA